MKTSPTQVVSAFRKLFVIFLITLSALQTYAQEHVRSMTHGQGGALLRMPNEIYTFGNYAFATSDNCVTILDVTDPRVPIHKSSICHGTTGVSLRNPSSVFLKGNYAYVSTMDGIEILDITDVSRPVHKGKVVYTINGNSPLLNSVIVIGNFAYSTSRYGKSLEVFNVSDPALPVRYASITHGTGGADLRYPSKAAYANGYAYVLNDNYSVEIINITNPAAPMHTSTITTGLSGAALNPMAIEVKNGYAYITTDGTYGLQIVNISNPATPVHVGHLLSQSTFNRTLGISVSGNYAYLPEFDLDQVKVVDVSNPALPIVASTLKNGVDGMVVETPSSTAVIGNYLYITSTYGGGVEVVDITNPIAAAHAAFLSHNTGMMLMDGANSVCVSGNYAYITGYRSNSLQIIDISNKQYPIKMGNLVDGAGGAMLKQPTSVTVVGTLAYVTCYGSNALEIVDISNPAAPVHKGVITNGQGGAALSMPTNVIVSGNLAYIASTGSNALEIVDVTNPALPVHKGKIVNGEGGAVLYNPVSLSKSGNYVYVVNNREMDLEVIDVSVPTTPVHFSKVYLNQGFGGPFFAPRSVSVSGNFAYVAVGARDTPPGLGENFMRVYDISNPATPLLKSTIDVSYPSSIFVSGNYAYLTGSTSNQLQIVDVTDPTEPFHSGTLSNGTGGALLSSPKSVVKSGDYVYVASETSNSFSIIKFLPMAITSFSPTKGERGSSTTICGTNIDTTPGAVEVYLAGWKANITSVTANCITITIPEGYSNPISVVRLPSRHKVTTSSDFVIVPHLEITSPSTGVYGSYIDLTVDRGTINSQVTYSVANGTGTATVTGNRLSLTGAGKVVVTAKIAATSSYTSNSATQEITITKANQVITFNDVPDLCQNATYVLPGTTTSGLTLTYLTSNSAIASISGNVLTAISPGRVIITARQSGNVNYNAATDVTQEIIIKSLPVVNVTPSAPTICFGSSVNLTATGATTYAWSAGLSAATGSTVTASPTSTTTYTVTGTSTDNCTATRNVTVTVTPKTVVTTHPSTASQTVCVNTEFSPLSVAGTGTGTMRYQWYRNTSNSSGGMAIVGATGSGYLPPANVAGTTYYYSAALTSNCGTVFSLPSGAIKVLPFPSITSQPSSSYTVCQNSPYVQLEIIATPGSGTIRYQWYKTENGVRQLLSGATSSRYFAPTLIVGTVKYEALVSDACSSTISNVISVTVNPIAVVSSFEGTSQVCPNNTYYYKVNIVGGDKQSYTYTWRKPENWTPVTENRDSAVYSTPSGPGYGPVGVSIFNGYCTSGSGLTAYPQGCPVRLFSDDELFEGADDIVIHPNPAHDEVEISLPQPLETDSKISVYSVVGQVNEAVIKKRTTSTKMSTRNFSPGLYIFQIETPSGVVTKRVMVLH